MMAKSVRNKWCFVPCCLSTSRSCPGKEFLTVPSNYKERTRWFEASRRDMKRSPLSPKTHLYCCEDHFDLENDLENYLKFKFYRNARLSTLAKLKPGVIPHRFNCQEGSQWTAGGSRLRGRKLLSLENESSCCSPEVYPKTSREYEVIEEIIGPEEEDSRYPLEDSAVQVNLKPNFRSAGLQVKPAVTDRCLSPIYQTVSVGFGTQISLSKRRHLDSYNDTSGETIQSVDSSNQIINTTDSISTDTKQSEGEEMKVQRRKNFESLWHIERRPEIYTGMNKELYGLVPVVTSAAGLAVRDVLLVLRKLTLNESFHCLGDLFNVSPDQASRIFSKNINVLSSVMKPLIYWPEKSEIIRLLPIPFRHRYNKLQSIIDCFEIKIEKPLNPFNQCATWSQYQQCNTVKYLISFTPNGFVTFISRGYGGRTTDTTLTQECGYLDLLKPGMLIMAERGFKNLAFTLSQLGVSIVELPNASSGQKSKEHEVKTVKRIARLKIHVERVIGRIRTFQFLSPNVCMDSKLVHLLDAAILVIAGLVNMQDPLFM